MENLAPKEAYILLISLKLQAYTDLLIDFKRPLIDSKRPAAVDERRSKESFSPTDLKNRLSKKMPAHKGHDKRHNLRFVTTDEHK
jgi:hypothetical protein